MGTDIEADSEAIGELAEVEVGAKKSRSYIGHRFSIATAISSQVKNYAASAVQFFFQSFCEGSGDRLGERVDFNHYKFTLFTTRSYTQIPLITMKIKPRRFLTT